MKTPSRIPCLDGLRALSITLVILSHIHHSLHPNRDSELHAQLVLLGNLGVRVFFIISGFLITSLLLREHAKYGTLSLKHFYIRRTLRLFPAFYVFVAAVLGASALGWVQFQPGDLLHALTYTMNYHQDRTWAFGHLWSLAVEEQFYLLWPLTLLLLGPSKGLKAALAVVLLVPWVRFATYHLLPESRPAITETFQTVADSIATGCLLAGVRGWLGERPWYQSLQRSRLFALAPLVIFGLNALREHINFSYVLGEPLLNVTIALSVDWCLRYPESRFGRWLDGRVLSFIGVMSYSLYLWQQPFFNAHAQSWLLHFPFNVILAFAAALGSYYLVEKPFLRLRERIEPLLARRSPPALSPVALPPLVDIEQAPPSTARP